MSPVESKRSLTLPSDLCAACRIGSGTSYPRSVGGGSEWSRGFELNLPCRSRQQECVYVFNTADALESSDESEHATWHIGGGWLSASSWLWI